MRLFIAIELPDRLKMELGHLKTDIPGARWLPPEQIHLTLAFLGEVDIETTEQLNARLARIQAVPFNLSLAGTGCFPNRHHPRVVWAGIKPEPCLTELAITVHEAVLSCGIAQEERPFSPHITLARLKIPSSKGTCTFLDLHQSLTMPPFPVEEFILFQSRLTKEGAEHIPVRRFPLAT